MNVCNFKRETGRYWLIHGIIWTGITLPTIFFLIRISRFQHANKNQDINTTSKDTYNPVKDNVSILNANENYSECLHPLVKDDKYTCQVPCDWSLMNTGLLDAYYVVMVVNFWAALISTVLTLITLASFGKLREFPHIVRFYILLSSALYATVCLLPLRIGLAKVYCDKQKYWNDQGHSTTATIVSGALTHYFFLAFCFWSLCYVINAYTVIVRHVHKVLYKKHKYHLIQLLVCSFTPALFVALNIAIEKPGYETLFLDRMTSVFTSPTGEYVTFTLPIQISLGITISLLWAIVRYVRKVRKNNASTQAIRSGEDIKGFINAECQFTKLALLFIVTIIVVLCSQVVLLNRNEDYLHNFSEYFACLKKHGKRCKRPESQIFILSSVQICAPGFYCLINFFLLFFNKDTRHVWKKWCKIFSICCPGKKTNKDETDLPNVSGSLMKNEEQTRSSTMETNVL